MSSKAAQARSLGISRQALYYKPKQEAKDLQFRDDILHLLKIVPDHGHKRLVDAFKHHLHRRVGKNRIRRVMKKYHIELTTRQRRYVKNTDEYRLESIPNRIQHICPIQPDVIWAGDFTYLWFHGRYIYLATVIDLYTREIIGWQIGLHHTTRLIIDVLEEAVERRGTTPIYFHSDQGSEYASHESIEWLMHHRIIPSHSPKGKPWHNGTQESFYHSFKVEFVGIGGVRHARSLEELIERIGKYIHYYNTIRIHGKLHMPPRAFYERKKWKK